MKPAKVEYEVSRQRNSNMSEQVLGLSEVKGKRTDKESESLSLCALSRPADKGTGACQPCALPVSVGLSHALLSSFLLPSLSLSFSLSLSLSSSRCPSLPHSLFTTTPTDSGTYPPYPLSPSTSSFLLPTRLQTQSPFLFLPSCLLPPSPPNRSLAWVHSSHRNPKVVPTTLHSTLHSTPRTTLFLFFHSFFFLSFFRTRQNTLFPLHALHSRPLFSQTLPSSTL